MEVIKDVIGVWEEDAEDRVRWREGEEVKLIYTYWVYMVLPLYIQMNKIDC